MKLKLFITFLFLGVLKISAQEILWVDSMHYDFGEIQQGIGVEHIFYFKNHHFKVVAIETVRTDCGCTETVWSESSIEPDQVGQINVKYDAFKRGYFRKKIKVFFKNIKKSHTLVIEGFVN